MTEKIAQKEWMKPPWQTGDYDPRVVFDAHGNEVVTVHEHYSVAVPRARLIAQAPRMYEVLKRLRPVVRWAEENYSTGDELSREIDAALAAVEGNGDG